MGKLSQLGTLLKILCKMVSSPFEGHSRKMLRGASHPRSFSHRGENEQGARRSPCRRIAPHSERGRHARVEEVALAAAQTRRESENGTALPVTRSPPLQPEDRTRLPSEGSLSATLGLQLARMGRKVPR